MSQYIDKRCSDFSPKMHQKLLAGVYSAPQNPYLYLRDTDMDKRRERGKTGEGTGKGGDRGKEEEEGNGMWREGRELRREGRETMGNLTNTVISKSRHLCLAVVNTVVRQSHWLLLRRLPDTSSVSLAVLAASWSRALTLSMSSLNSKSSTGTPLTRS